MQASRLTHVRYAEDLSGYGAFKVGGRWNPRGYHTLYLSEHPCGTILECLIHMAPQIIPDDYSLVTFKIVKNEDIKEVKESDLPQGWRENDYDLALYQGFGKTNLFDKNILGLYLPSSVAYPSYNYVLNCKHEEFRSSIEIIDIKAYVFDTRLVQMMSRT